MPPLNTHLLIADRLFPRLGWGESALSPFLAGNLVVDANSFTTLPRPRTHLVERWEEATGMGYRRFLLHREELLRRPWAELTEEEQAFVGGYLAHLAADAAWKARLAGLYRRWGIGSWRDLPIPVSVFLTEMSVLCADHFLDFERIVRALRDYPRVPDLFVHVPHAALQHTWEIGRTVMDRPYRRDSFYAMLRLKGVGREALEEERRDHERYGDAARAFILKTGAVEWWIAPLVELAEAALREMFAGKSASPPHASPSSKRL